MRWEARVNGNGRAFQQWHATTDRETLPEWGPGEAIEACPVCGERYELREKLISGEWRDTQRFYIYHDPVMHRDYRLIAEPEVELRAPRRATEVS